MKSFKKYLGIIRSSSSFDYAHAWSRVVAGGARAGGGRAGGGRARGYVEGGCAGGTSASGGALRAQNIFLFVRAPARAEIKIFF